MSAPTKYLPAQLVKDLHDTLAALRVARDTQCVAEEMVCEHRLNVLIEKLPRTLSIPPAVTIHPQS